MKCPYDPNYVSTSTKHDPKYRRIGIENCDGTPDAIHLTCNDETLMTIHQYRDCLNYDCAAWQNDHCVRTA